MKYLREISGERMSSSAANKSEFILRLLSDNPQAAPLLRRVDKGVEATIADKYLSCSTEELLSEFNVPKNKTYNYNI